jgi:prepilin-type processing-associated H-X9-DG protein
MLLAMQTHEQPGGMTAARHSLDRHASYAVTAWLDGSVAEGEE